MYLTRSSHLVEVDVLYTSVNPVRSCPDISSGPTLQASLSVLSEIAPDPIRKPGRPGDIATVPFLLKRLLYNFQIIASLIHISYNPLFWWYRML
jgi:hypothetical protein